MNVFQILNLIVHLRPYMLLVFLFEHFVFDLLNIFDNFGRNSLCMNMLFFQIFNKSDVLVYLFLMFFVFLSQLTDRGQHIDIVLIHFLLQGPNFGSKFCLVCFYGVLVFMYAVV